LSEDWREGFAPVGPVVRRAFVPIFRLDRQTNRVFFDPSEIRGLSDWLRSQKRTDELAWLKMAGSLVNLAAKRLNLTVPCALTSWRSCFERAEEIPMSTLIKVTRMDNDKHVVLNLCHVSTIEVVPEVKAKPAFGGTPAMPAQPAVPGRPKRPAVQGREATANSPAIEPLPEIPEVPDVPARPETPELPPHPAIHAHPESAMVYFINGRDPLHVKETVDVLLGK
jgi:hypothetical protein